MTEKQLHLAKGLDVPRSIAARTVFVAGTKGSGKTYGAGVIAEELLAAGVHVAILDPLGVWYGLRHDADGGPGGFPIVILGGEHADVPLLPTGGEAVGEFIVRSGQSCIIDMSGFDSDAEQDRFVEALLVKLFRMKSTDKSALHLIMDEADMFVPEQPMKGQERLVGAGKRIVTKGRSRGLSMTMITQRPQSIKKACIEESDVVLCYRIQGINAAKAMKAWTDLYATAEQAKEFYDSLPTLADGEAWVWSPRFLKMFARHQFRRKETFDSSRTPDPGEVVRKPKAAARVDLDKLTTEIKASAEAAKKSDPRELQRIILDQGRKIAELEKRPAAAAPAQKVKTVEKFVLKDGQLDRAENLIGKVFDLHAKSAELLITLKTTADEISAAIRKTREPAPVMPARPASAAAPRPAFVPRVSPQRAAPRHETNGDTAPGDFQPSRPQQRVLDAIAWFNSIGVDAPSRAAVGFVARIKPTGGHFRNTVGPLSTHGLIEAVGDDGVRLTDAGAALATAPAGPPTLDAYHAAIRSVLNSGASQRVFDAIIGGGGADLTVEEIGEVSAIDPGGGHFRNSIGPLGTLGLIQRRGNVVHPTDLLFPKSLVNA